MAHVSCLAHNINLVMTKALGAKEEVVKVIEKIKRIVAYFKHSNVAQDHLREEQKKEGKSEGTYLYLKQEVPTRWNSTFYCIERFALLSPIVGKILLSPSHKDAPPMPTAEELDIMGDVVEVLAPFEASTKQISGDKYISGNLVIPMCNCICIALSKINVNNSVAGELLQKLREQIKKRLDPLEENPLLAAATILDPRFKKIHFKSPINAAKAVTQLRDEIKAALRSQGSLSPPIVTNQQNTDDLWSVHDTLAAESFDGIPDPQDGSLPTEFKLYLNQPLLSRSLNPIQFWKDRRNAFPAMYEVAMKYLTVVGASVASERVVSLLNFLSSDHRSRLTPDHINQLIFLGSIDDDFWDM
ncbi:zinc finger BED domain-containing protein 4-like [Ischnura elegans]|uniref:zinc finger BED domain-containing protein 4-like n=1 Tax=Ischnura elegans TaxID=197161 RepID=UPI001ED86D62|nr:zinc finger BED domain-containing protein 4-like [Ischnura elegans]